MMVPAAPVVEQARWKTIAGDVLGSVAVIWAIPVGIILVGLPVALLFLLARTLWNAL